MRLNKTGIKRRDRAARKAAGLCTSCSNVAVEGKTLCTSCNQKDRDRRRLARARALAEGMCGACKKRPRADGTTRCNHCRKRDSTKYKAKTDESKEQRRLRLLGAGMCTVCAKRTSLVATRKNKHPQCEQCYYKTTAGNKRTLKSTKNWQLLKDLMEAQDYTCPYTGITLYPGLNCELDHIESVAQRPDLMNEITNMQWVHKDVNRMKRHTSEQDFLDMCSRITTYRSRQR